MEVKVKWQNNKCSLADEVKEITESTKGAWGMPWLSEAKKDVTSCDKPRRGANIPRSVDFRMGQPAGSDSDTLP